MDDDQIIVLRRLMADYDQAAFVLDGSFEALGIGIEEKAVEMRRAVRAAGDAVFKFLEAVEQKEKQNGNEASLPHR